MDVGIKASIAGSNVLTAPVEELTFTSNYPIFKVNQEGAGVVTVSSGSTNGYTDVTHSLSYRPFVVGFSDPDTGSSRRLLLVGRTPVTGGPRKYLQTTTTNFRVIIEKVPAPGSNENYNFYAYVMIDQVAT